MSGLYFNAENSGFAETIHKPSLDEFIADYAIDFAIETANAIEFRIENMMLDNVESRLNQHGWFKRKTCTAVYPIGDSDYSCEHGTPRCSECGRPIVVYESQEKPSLANFCHYCGEKVEVSDA